MFVDPNRHRTIPLAAAGDTNPKRQRGNELKSSLTLRVGVGGPFPDRAEHSSESQRSGNQQKYVHLRRLSLVFAVLCACSIGLPARAGDDPENETLKKNKLKTLGSLEVLEDETEFKTKLTEARRLQRQLSYSLLQQQRTMSPEQYQKTLQGIRDELSQMKTQIGQLSQQMSNFPRFRGRFMSTYAQEEYNELTLYRNQLQMQVNQESASLNQLQSQKADPKAKEKIDAEVHDRREAYHQAILDLRTLADAVTQKYAELAKDSEVKDAIHALGKGKREKPKLGPSHDFLNNVKLLEKLEKAESAGAGDPFQEKPARRSRSKGRSKTKDAASTKTEKPEQ
jgi:archaellum component FlaC